MNSQKVAGILGAIVALAVLAAAFIYVPPGGRNAPAAVAPKAEAPVNAAPAPKGPVIRDVPQQ
ncbi:hypothetical protein [Bradyrhizobium canariense]|uniref:Uncharacterized protein n=1 Tax=Bradyrhizobium canariense TaxID=255045 RepID=A0A1H2BT12_9BRAD|nr:hypothetical protein [Bradyrhizobium canariense]SDT61381.1 hypothetical protein SAMN05444158_7509 [Bradyrhizobium canariense]